MSKLKELKGQLEAKLAGIRELTAAAAAEDRDFSGEERQKAEAMLAEAREVHERMKDLEAGEAIRQQLVELGAAVGSSDPGKATERPEVASPGKGKTFGERFLEAPALKAWREGLLQGGRISEKVAIGSSPPIGFDVGLKTLLTSTSVTDGIITPDHLGLQDGLLFRTFTIRDIITVGQTDSDTVEFVRELSKTNAAAAVPEAASPTDDTAKKPESAFTLEKVSETVKTVAHTLPATKRVLSDAAQVRTLIDGFLRDGLTEELEDQIITGDGSGENFLGLLNTPGVQSQGFDVDILRTARKARTLVKTVGRAQATAYLMHPNDWEAYDLLKDDQGRYYFGGPLDMGQPRLWGLPVVESEAITEGSPMVGDFRKAVLWDRQQATISVTDSHDDFFIRNLVMFLAELRAAFGVIRPAAFVQFDMVGS